MQSQKHLFHLRPGIHYLNCAYKSPLLKSAEVAAHKALVQARNPSDIQESDFFSEAEEVRSHFSKLINSASSRIALIPSTSYGFSSVLNNVKPKVKGQAISIQDEFPSAYFSLKNWCQKHENDFLLISPDAQLRQIGEDWNQKILQAIQPNTSLVMMSSIHWMNGLKFDLKAIGEKCAAMGATFIVDGTQSVGAMEMDVQEYKIDALICATYKWLFGPYSLALAYFGPRFDQGTPLEEAWLNRKNAQDFSKLTQYQEEYQAEAARYNVGESSNFILLPMMKAALQQIQEWKVREIQAYCEELIQPLKDYLQEENIQLEEEKYFSKHLFALPLRPNINPQRLQEELKKNQVFVSLRGEYIRVSVNVFNEAEDIQVLIQSLKKLHSPK